MIIIIIIIKLIIAERQRARSEEKLAEKIENLWIQENLVLTSAYKTERRTPVQTLRVGVKKTQ